MTSFRHKPLKPQAAAVLSATKLCVLAVGVRRTTLTEVARRAGVSRMTVYRHYPDTTALVAALMTREFGAQLEVVIEAASGRPDARARLVEATATGVRALASHALFRRVLEVDPELLLPYLVLRLGRTQRMVLSLFRQLIEDGQADGSVRNGKPRVLALALMLAVQSFLVSARLVSPRSRRAVDVELRSLVDRYLAP